MEPMRAEALCYGAIGRRSRFHRDASGCCSLALLSLRPLRPLRFYVANDKRSLPQNAQSCGGEKDMEPMRAEALCYGAIGRHSRVHREVVECCSVTLLSLRPLRPLRALR